MYATLANMQMCGAERRVDRGQDKAKDIQRSEVRGQSSPSSRPEGRRFLTFLSHVIKHLGDKNERAINRPLTKKKHIEEKTETQSGSHARCGIIRAILQQELKKCTAQYLSEVTDPQEVVLGLAFVHPLTFPGNIDILLLLCR